MCTAAREDWSKGRRDRSDDVLVYQHYAIFLLEQASLDLGKFSAWLLMIRKKKQLGLAFVLWHEIVLLIEEDAFA